MSGGGIEKIFTTKSKIHGEGTFAESLILKGSLIRVFGGDVVNFKEILRRIKAGKIVPDDPLQIGDDLYVDLDEPSMAFNHSCDPNAGIRYQNELVAIRDISPGEEITYDYSATVSKTVSEKGWSMLCQCGAVNCRSRIGNVLTIPRKQLEDYISADALQSYIVEEICDLLRMSNKE